MLKKEIKMFRFIKKIFVGLLASVVSASSHAKFEFLSYRKCKIQPTFINLHPKEYTQGLHYYLFAVSLDICIEILFRYMCQNRVVILLMNCLIKYVFQTKQKV